MLKQGWLIIKSCVRRCTDSHSTVWFFKQKWLPFPMNHKGHFNSSTLVRAIVVLCHTVQHQMWKLFNICMPRLQCFLQMSRSCKSLLLRQRQASNKVYFPLLYFSEKYHFIVRNFGRYEDLGKQVQ